MELNSIDVAITIDDLPSHGPLTPDTSRLAIHQQLVAAFARHGVRACGFVVGKDIDTSADHQAALSVWYAAGHTFANHTFSHQHTKDLGVPRYMSDIVKGQRALERAYPDALAGPQRFFRYPYLDVGFDRTSVLALRRFLEDSGYCVAGGSISFMDWEWNLAYVNALCRGEDDNAARVRSSFVPTATANLLWSHETAVRLFKRPMKHIVIMHAGVLEAHTMDALLTAYENAGARFITLGEALADPIYKMAGVPHGSYPRNVLHDTVHACASVMPQVALPRHPMQWLRSIVDAHP